MNETEKKIDVIVIGELNVDTSHIIKSTSLSTGATLFVNRTGVHALAIAIGSAHGFNKQVPKLDIVLLARINNNLHTPLVLHGSSGIPDATKAVEDLIVKKMKTIHQS